MLKTICSLIPLVTISSFFFVLCSYLFQISAFLAVSWRHPHLLSLSSSLCLSFPFARSLTHQFLLFVEGLLQLGNGTFFITLKLTHYLTQSLSHSLTHMLARSPARSLTHQFLLFVDELLQLCHGVVCFFLGLGLEFLGLLHLFYQNIPLLQNHPVLSHRKY